MAKKYIDSMEFRFGRLKGFLLLLFSLFITASLVTYNPFDSCFHVKSSTIITNKAGRYGAFISDILLQYFGYTSYYINILLYYFSFVLIIYKHIKKFKIKLLTSNISILLLIIIINSIKGIYIFSNAILPSGYIGFVIMKWMSKFSFFYKAMIYLASYALFITAISYIFEVKLANKKPIVQKDKKHKKSVIKVFKALLKPFLTLLQLPVLLYKYLLMKHKLKKKNKEEKSEKIIPEISNKKDNIHQQQMQEKTNILIANNNIAKSENSYVSPSVHLLSDEHQHFVIPTESVIKSDIIKLSKILSDFGIRGEITGFRAGPVVSLFEFRLEPGIKSSRVVSLCDDIARMMIVSSVRIATIPNQDKLGIEMPNKQRSIVSFKKLINHQEYQNSKAHIPLILGCDIFGNPVIQDLTTMPHLLIAGTTGSGKSVGVNGMILSILFKLSSQKCKFIMIDPKMLEFSMYNDIPHLLMPVITDSKQAVIALKWAVKEMESRYYKMSSLGVRNIYGYNQKIATENVAETYKELPFIVVIIDEMADLMLVAGKEVEVLVQRLSQMARAAGIHLIMATQRPSVDVVTGVIKANFPSRISYHVTSKIDSRTIVGEQGAEQLLGKGDMLCMIGGGKLNRIHGPFVPDVDVEHITNDLKSRYTPEYIDIFTNDESDDEDDGAVTNYNSSGQSDDLYQQAINIVLEERKTSISYIQRKLRIGYNKAANFVEQMEKDGILSEADHTGKRTILDDN